MLSGFELYPRWVPLSSEHTNRHSVLFTYENTTLYNNTPITCYDKHEWELVSHAGVFTGAQPKTSSPKNACMGGYMRKDCF